MSIYVVAIYRVYLETVLLFSRIRAVDENEPLTDLPPCRMLTQYPDVFHRPFPIRPSFDFVTSPLTLDDHHAVMSLSRLQLAAALLGQLRAPHSVRLLMVRIRQSRRTAHSTSCFASRFCLVPTLQTTTPGRNPHLSPIAA